MTSKPSIALICQHFYPEMISTGMHMTELMVALAQKGWSIRVYCTQPVYRDVDQERIVAPQRERYRDVEIHRLRTLGSQRATLIQRALNAITFLLSITWALIRDRRAIIGVINTTNPPFLGVAAMVVHRLFGLPYVTIVYDVYPDVAICLGVLHEGTWLVRFWRWITAQILGASTGLVVIGRDMEEIIKKRYVRGSRPEIELIPNWSDETHVKPVAVADNAFVREHRLSDRFVVQYAGRMGRTHNIEPLIEAARLLQDVPVLFQIVGDGAKRSALETMVEEYGLENVQFLPYQPYERLAEVLSAADLSVVCLDLSCSGLSVPSKTYGIMAAANPILAFLHPHSEVGAMLQETESGVVLANPTAEDIATLIRSFLHDPQRAREMGQSGYETFLSNYTLSHAVARYDAFLSHHFSTQKLE